MTNGHKAVMAISALWAVSMLPVGAGATTDMAVQWKDGLVFSGQDGQTQVKIGGRVMNDWAWFDADAALADSLGPIEDGTEIRRARLYISGTLRGGIEFKGQYDFAGSKVRFKDAYVGLKEAFGPFGVRVGQFKQPVGLDVLTSSNDIVFMNRASPAVLLPDRRTGLMVHGPLTDAKRATLAASVFRETNDAGVGTGNGAYSFAGRVTALPFGDEEGDLVHLGVSGAWRQRGDDTLEIQIAPESHLGPDFQTLSVGADHWSHVGFEAAGVFGSAHLQGEYVTMSSQGAGGAPDVSIDGYYVQAGVFLTGERLPYKRSSAVFTRVKPHRDFRGEEGGFGAVQLVVRYSNLDLKDPQASAGGVDGVAAGVNWYLNSNSRVMLDYFRADSDTRSAPGVLQGLEARFQVAF